MLKCISWLFWLNLTAALMRLFVGFLLPMAHLFRQLILKMFLCEVQVKAVQLKMPEALGWFPLPINVTRVFGRRSSHGKSIHNFAVEVLYQMSYTNHSASINHNHRKKKNLFLKDIQYL